MQTPKSTGANALGRENKQERAFAMLEQEHKPAMVEEDELTAPKTEKKLKGKDPFAEELIEKMPFFNGNIKNLEEDILKGNISLSDRQLLN